MRDPDHLQFFYDTKTNNVILLKPKYFKSISEFNIQRYWLEQ
jgi:hypothetical protein